MEQKHKELDVKGAIDAVKVSGSAFLIEAFKRCSQFHREYDYRLTGTAEEKLYERVCGYITPTGTKIGVAYHPAHGYMPACIFTISPPDTGLERRELDEIIQLVPEYRFTKIEYALVFRPGSFVNLASARKYLVVGKSQPSGDPRYPGTLYFGSRRSAA